MPDGSPAPSAGLLPPGSMVCMGPPLFASAPSCGFSGAADVPTRLPLTPFVIPVIPVEMPIRLFPPFENWPEPSGLGLELESVFPARIVFVNWHGVLGLMTAMPPPKSVDRVPV